MKKWRIEENLVYFVEAETQEAAESSFHLYEPHDSIYFVEEVQ